MMIDLIGTLAPFLTTASFIPQAVLVLRARNTSGISLATYAMFTVGVAAWLVYGLLLGSLPIIVANIVTLALSACILGVTINDRLHLLPPGEDTLPSQ
tara:strand:- start:122 stop:415 length:294 start_codon:yes stop_codon:yes gene_type:complete